MAGKTVPELSEFSPEDIATKNKSDCTEGTEESRRDELEIIAGKSRRRRPHAPARGVGAPATWWRVGARGGYSGDRNGWARVAGGWGAYTNETLNALFHAQDSLKTQNIKISKAKKSNPGLPPSSLMAFVRKNPQTSGIVLEDFDDAYRNKFYHSHLDDQSNVNSSAIVAAASLVARSLYILASDKKEVNASLLTTINANSSLVEELLGCLLSCEPGLSCGLVKSYIAPSMSCPSHYVGVILGEPSSVPYLGNVGDVSRFIWNFLAEKTSIRPTNTTSACPKDCGRDGEACIQTETDGKGICVISTTRYVPAYSTRLKYESDTWMVLPSNSTEPDPDPVWTESNWDMIRLRAYTVQGASYDRFLLLLGIVVTVLAYLIIVMTRAFITKAMKCD